MTLKSRLEEFLSPNNIQRWPDLLKITLEAVSENERLTEKCFQYREAQEHVSHKMGELNLELEKKLASARAENEKLKKLKQIAIELGKEQLRENERLFKDLNDSQESVEVLDKQNDKLRAELTAARAELAREQEISRQLKIAVDKADMIIKERDEARQLLRECESVLERRYTNSISPTGTAMDAELDALLTKLKTQTGGKL